jgi:outer membrane murein-binding lipoprotein Lpp
MRLIKFVLFAVLAASFYSSGCKTQSNNATAQAQATARASSDSIQQQARQTAQEYHAMTDTHLLEKLVEQSRKQKEPFNSLAYRELRNRKDVSADSILTTIRQLKNADALLPLLLLRKLHVEIYKAVPADERAAVLTDALEKSKTFNTWGFPHLYLEDASKAMIECGPSAQPALKRMLSGTRPAPLWGGGQTVMESERYKYRLCDYALFFLEKMQPGNNFVMPVNPDDRDSLIKALMQ